MKNLSFCESKRPEKQHATEGCVWPAAGGLGPGGGDLGEFTLGKRRGLLGECSRPPQVACAHAPSVGKSAQWAGSPVGLAPPNRPTGQRALHIWRAAVSKDLLTSDFEQSFRLLAALGVLLGRPGVVPGLFFVKSCLRRHERHIEYVVFATGLPKPWFGCVFFVKVQPNLGSGSFGSRKPRILHDKSASGEPRCPREGSSRDPGRPQGSPGGL